MHAQIQVVIDTQQRQRAEYVSSLKMCLIEFWNVVVDEIRLFSVELFIVVLLHIGGTFLNSSLNLGQTPPSDSFHGDGSRNRRALRLGLLQFWELPETLKCRTWVNLQLIDARIRPGIALPNAVRIHRCMYYSTNCPRCPGVFEFQCLGTLAKPSQPSACIFLLHHLCKPVLLVQALA